MCICWCVTEINYKMHGKTLKIPCETLFNTSLLIWHYAVWASERDSKDENNKKN